MRWSFFNFPLAGNFSQFCRFIRVFFSPVAVFFTFLPSIAFSLILLFFLRLSAFLLVPLIDCLSLFSFSFKHVSSPRLPSTSLSHDLKFHLIRMFKCRCQRLVILCVCMMSIIWTNLRKLGHSAWHFECVFMGFVVVLCYSCSPISKKPNPSQSNKTKYKSGARACICVCVSVCNKYQTKYYEENTGTKAAKVTRRQIYAQFAFDSQSRAIAINTAVLAMWIVV